MYLLTFPPMSATPMAERIKNAMPILIALQRLSPLNTPPTTAATLPPTTLSMSAAFFWSALSFVFFAAAPNFLEASPIALRSLPSIAVLSAVADAARSDSPLASASLISFSTVGLFSDAVAANSPSVAQLNLGSGGRNPKSTTAMMTNPSQTAIQSSLRSRVNPFLFSDIGYPSLFEWSVVLQRVSYLHRQIEVKLKT